MFEKEVVRVCSDISSLKIQGAEHIAKAGVVLIKKIVKKYNKKTKNNFKELNKELIFARKRLFSTRPTEPLLFNCLNTIIGNFSSQAEKEDYDDLLSRISFVENHLSTSLNKIIDLGSEKIKNNYVVYTHCHSSTVTKILLNAKKSGKKFIVNNTETRPRFQGRITALELAKQGIKVNHFVDSSMIIAIKNADIIFIGADSISLTSVFNKIGSGIVCELASVFDIPVYVCADSWKIDINSNLDLETKIEERNSKEVWNVSNKNINVNNPAFEMVNSSLIHGIISELGILSHRKFIQKFRNDYNNLM